MPKVKVNVCQDVNEYKNKKNCISTNIRTDHIEIVRNAKTLGNLSSYTLSGKGKMFFVNFVKMMLEEDTLKIRNDYFQAETSLITSYSFLMGMILTKEIAEKRYNIANLYHLNDNIIKIKPVKAKKGTYKHPDFFGDNGKDYYLFEAKGRKKNNLPNDDADKARKQLENVHVTYNHMSSSKSKFLPNSDIKKHIINSVFKKPGSDLDIWDIDPPGESDENPEFNLEINQKDLLLNYYKNILFKEQLNRGLREDDELITETYNNVDYKVIKDDANSFGLQKDIFDNLKNIYEYNSYDSSNSYMQGLINQHTEIINENKNKSQDGDTDTSIGMDGIIFSYYNN